jgi:hypothetical protein
MNKFTYENSGEKIEMSLSHNDATLDEVLETFTRFLKAQGFQAPSNTSYLAWTDDFIELEDEYDIDFDNWQDPEVAYHDSSKVTRVEVIDSSGRAYVNTIAKDVALAYQDDGKTLKIFLSSDASKVMPNFTHDVHFTDAASYGGISLL